MLKSKKGLFLFTFTALIFLKMMNTYKLLFFCVLFTSFSAIAQNYNGNGQNNYGVNRDIGRTYSGSQKPSTEQTEKNKTEQLDKFIAKLKKDLTLDELQTIAIKNEIAANSRNIDIVAKKEISDEEKSKEIKALMEKTELIINSYLNKVQKEKFTLLKEETKSKKKDKKNKKEAKNMEE